MGLSPVQSLKLQFFFFFFKFTLNSSLGKIFGKICWITFIMGCGGNILIKSLWFQSINSLELIGASGSFAVLSSPGLCPGSIRGYHRAPPSLPSRPNLVEIGLPKKSLVTVAFSTVSECFEIFLAILLDSRV